MQNGSYSTTVGVFEDKVPFSQRGLGSKRLLSIGMNVNAYKDGTLVLVDEVESGLEPYRISSLVNQFRSQFKDNGQLIMTTHSRSVVCECTVDELVVITNENGEVNLQALNSISDINADIQGLVRSQPDSFLCKRLIVCEGKTEVGFLRALDNFLFKQQGTRLAHFGVGVVPGGGGDNFFKLAKLVNKCGYDTCLLMDSDVSEEESKKKEIEKLGIPVFSWDSGNAIEEQIFEDASLDCVEDLIDIVVEERGINSVVNGLRKVFPNEDSQPWSIDDGRISMYEDITVEERHKIGSVAKAKNGKKSKYGEWFKNTTKGELVGNLIFQDLDNIDDDCGLKDVIFAIENWVTRG